MKLSRLCSVLLGFSLILINVSCQKSCDGDNKKNEQIVEKKGKLVLSIEGIMAHAIQAEIDDKKRALSKRMKKGEDTNAYINNTDNANSTAFELLKLEKEKEKYCDSINMDRSCELIRELDIPIVEETPIIEPPGSPCQNASVCIPLRRPLDIYIYPIQRGLDRFQLESANGEPLKDRTEDGYLLKYDIHKDGSFPTFNTVVTDKKSGRKVVLQISYAGK